MRNRIINFIRENFQEIIFFIICWCFGIILFMSGLANSNFDGKEINSIYLIISAVGLGLFLLPFFKKVKFGEIEIERQIRETKKEVREFKDEIRNSLSLISTSINTIGNVSNKINIFTTPGLEELKEAIERLKEQKQVPQTEVEQIKQGLVLDEDNLLALVRIRIRLEYILRKILNKENYQDRSMKFLGLNSLFQNFIKRHPAYEKYYQSFKYVIQITNAAAHAQTISENEAKEVLELGARLIAILIEDFPEVNNNEVNT